jgi:hypothetical protein
MQQAQHAVENHPEPILRAAAPWRYAPALIFAATPLVMWLGNWRRFQLYEFTHWDWEMISAMGSMALILAAFAAILAHRLDWRAAGALSLAAASAAWIAFGQPASSGGGAAIAGLGALALWLLSALVLWRCGWRPLSWLLWITYPLLLAISVGYPLLLRHQLQYPF